MSGKAAIFNTRIFLTCLPCLLVPTLAGTPLGDPVEAGGAAAVLAVNRSSALAGQASPLLLPLVFASDKSSIGHTEPAAGVQGILHAVASLCHKLVLPILHLEALNEHVAGGAAGAAMLDGTVVAPRQRAGAPAVVATAPGLSATVGEGALCGVSSFAFQGEC